MCVCFFFSNRYSCSNSEDPDQTRSAASDLGLYCLPMSQKWDARLIWVNSSYIVFNVDLYF